MNYKVSKWKQNVTSRMYFNVALGILWAILAPITNFSDIQSYLTYNRG